MKGPLYILLLTCGFAFANPEKEQLVGHWSGHIGWLRYDVTFSRDGTFSGHTSQKGLVVWEYAGNWSISDDKLNYEYTKSSLALAPPGTSNLVPPGTIDQDRLVEVTKDYYVIEARDGSRRTCVREPTPPEQPSAPWSLQQPQKQRTVVVIKPVTPTSTPLGQYRKILNDAVGSHWDRHMAEHPLGMALGTIDVSFWVDPSGRIKDAKITRNSTSSEVSAACLQSILETTLPPIPEKVASLLPPKGLASEIRFTLSPK
jgi:hypothetical protein